MRFRFGLIACLVLGAHAARGQDPVRLPGMQVSVAAPIGPRRITGFVFDAAGAPVAGAEVIVPYLRRRAITGRLGTFRFDSVPEGVFDIRARKIGYAPQWRKIAVDSVSGYTRFELVPVVSALPPTVSSAARRGLTGNVADMRNQAVPDATVTALGAGLHTTTDGQGNFFLPVEAGRYMISIARDSFETKLVSVSIPADSGRHILAWLPPGGKPDKAHSWNIVDDLPARLAYLKPAESVLFTREDLMRMNIEWVYDAVAATGPRFRFSQPISRECMVVVNGGPEITSLATVTIDDVESVEVYPEYHDVFPSVLAAGPQSKVLKAEALKNNPQVTGGAFDWLNNNRFAKFENKALVCPGVYIWTR